MKKVIFAVAAAMVMGFAACANGNEGEKVVSEYKALVEKAEKAFESGDAATLIEAGKEMMEMGDKYENVSLTSDQEEEILELTQRLQKALGQ